MRCPGRDGSRSATRNVTLSDDAARAPFLDSARRIRRARRSATPGSAWTHRPRSASSSRSSRPRKPERARAWASRRSTASSSRAPATSWSTSEVGRGTRFDIYFPRVQRAGARRAGRRLAPHDGGRNRRRSASCSPRTRTRCAASRGACWRCPGYTVLEARSAEEAYGVAQRFPGQARLLVTDVVMTGESGRELARQHPGELAGDQGPLRLRLRRGVRSTAKARWTPSAHFLQKPFTPDALLRKVRESPR